MKNSKFDKLFKLIMEQFNKSMYDDDFYDPDYSNKRAPKVKGVQEVVTINNGNMIDITSEMFAKAGINTSIPVYDVTGYEDPGLSKVDGYTGDAILITNNLESAQNFGSEINELEIDDDGNAWLNVAFEGEKFTKAHIMCKYADKEICIALIK